MAHPEWLSSCHPIVLLGQAAAEHRGSSRWAACVSPAVCPRPHTGLAAGWETGVTLSTLCSLGPKCSLNSGTEHSLGKCGAGPCNSCPHILHFA